MIHPRGLAELSQAELAVLLPEYLLCGHLIDRAGMPHAIAALGLEGMRDVAIEEWMGASPIYTKRMQRALGFEGDSVEVIFKGMQLDVGAPPQFMDFRYVVHDHDRGEFHLDHCGALMDVEPMGEDYVVAMCHDIEDPTFDATAIATNTRAQVRPVHRPPRTPVDRHPHCAWTVTIAPDHDELPIPDEAVRMGATAAARCDLAAIDPSEPGLADYAGPLLDDLRFTDWSRSLLLRTAEEVCLQWHLLALSFAAAVAARLPTDAAAKVARQQLAGIAGVTSERLRHALGLGTDLDGAAQVLRLHPVLLPSAYVDCSLDDGDGRLVLRLGRGDGASADGAWPALIDADHLEPLDALLRGVDPRLRAVALASSGDELVVEVVTDDEPHAESADVALTRFSTGTDFHFSDRGTPVAIGRPS